MISVSIDGAEQRRAFALWLRTGRRPTVSATNVELKFNPWHDPDDGRFTHAGSGLRYGPGDAKAKGRGGRHSRPPTVGPVRKIIPRGSIQKVAEFIGGVGRGMRDVGRKTIDSLQEAVTNNPVTTVRRFGKEIAQTIDAAVTAEDIPAREQARRVGHFVATASARDIGYATGRITSNAGLAAIPGGAATKISAIGRIRALRPRETLRPPEVVWRKETLKESPAKSYNDATTGARPVEAPALTRTMSDRSTRLVKFDGIDGDYLIDRKWTVVNRANARAQMKRQSEALSQNKLVATWEVRTPRDRRLAVRMLKRMNIQNIKVRIAK